MPQLYKDRMICTNTPESIGKALVKLGEPAQHLIETIHIMERDLSPAEPLQPLPPLPGLKTVSWQYVHLSYQLFGHKLSEVDEKRMLQSHLKSGRFIMRHYVRMFGIRTDVIWDIEAMNRVNLRGPLVLADWRIHLRLRILADLPGSNRLTLWMSDMLDGGAEETVSIRCKPQ